MLHIYALGISLLFCVCVCRTFIYKINSLFVNLKPIYISAFKLINPPTYKVMTILTPNTIPGLHRESTSYHSLYILRWSTIPRWETCSCSCCGDIIPPPPPPPPSRLSRELNFLTTLLLSCDWCSIGCCCCCLVVIRCMVLILDDWWFFLSLIKGFKSWGDDQPLLLLDDGSLVLCGYLCLAKGGPGKEFREGGGGGVGKTTSLLLLLLLAWSRVGYEVESFITSLLLLLLLPLLLLLLRTWSRGGCEWENEDISIVIFDICSSIVGNGCDCLFFFVVVWGDERWR